MEIQHARTRQIIENLPEDEAEALRAEIAASLTPEPEVTVAEAVEELPTPEEPEIAPEEPADENALFGTSDLSLEEKYEAERAERIELENQLNRALPAEVLAVEMPAEPEAEEKPKKHKK